MAFLKLQYNHTISLNLGIVLRPYKNDYTEDEILQFEYRSVALVRVDAELIEILPVGEHHFFDYFATLNRIIRTPHSLFLNQNSFQRNVITA